MHKRVIVCVTAVALTLCSCASNNEPAYVWAEGYTDYPYLTSYNTSKKDLAPHASQFVWDFLQSIYERDSASYLDMANCMPVSMTVEQFHKFISSNTSITQYVDDSAETVTLEDTAGFIMAAKDSFKVNSTYDDDSATVILSTTMNKSNIEIPFELEYQDGDIRLTNVDLGILKDVTITVPGKCAKFNGAEYMDCLANLSERGEVYKFETFPDIDVVAQYQNEVGTFETPLLQADNAYNCTAPLTNKLDKAEWDSICDNLVQGVFTSLTSGTNEQVASQLINQDTANNLLRAWSSAQGRTISSVYVECNNLQDAYMPAANIYHIPVRYLTKFSIDWNVNTSLSSCKDFSWLEITKDEDGNWKLYDMGMNKKESIFTYLDETNNEW